MNLAVFARGGAVQGDASGTSVRFGQQGARTPPFRLPPNLLPFADKTVVGYATALQSLRAPKSFREQGNSYAGITLLQCGERVNHGIAGHHVASGKRQLRLEAA